VFHVLELELKERLSLLRAGQADVYPALKSAEEGGINFPGAVGRRQEKVVAVLRINSLNLA